MGGWVGGWVEWVGENKERKGGESDVVASPSLSPSPSPASERIYS